MPTVPNTILYAKMSQYFSAIDIKKSGVFGGGMDLNLPRKLYMIRKNVEWLYDLDPTDDTLTKTANYLYALCGKYALQAAQVSISNGMVVNPVSPTSPTAVTMPWYYVYKSDFTNSTDVINSAWDGKTISVFFNGVRYLDTNEFVLLSGGLLRILLSGFNSADFESGKIMFRVDINGEATESDSVESFDYNLSEATEITSLEAGTNNQRRTVVITPNGFAYTWPSTFVFTENWPEQPDAIGEDTKQIYLFQYISGVGDVCIGQSLNIPI